MPSAEPKPQPRPEAVLIDLARALAAEREEARVYAALCAALGSLVPGMGYAVVAAGRKPEVVFETGEPGVAAPPSRAAWARLEEQPVIRRRAHPDGAAPALLARLCGSADTLGALVVARPVGSRSTRAEAARLADACALAGAAVETARLLEAARVRELKAEWVEAIARELNASLELGEVVERIAQASAKQTGRPAVVWLAEPGVLRAAARAGGALIGVGEERPLPHDAEGRLLRLAQAPAEALLTEEVRALAREVGGPGRVVVPLTVAGELVGLVAAGPWVDAPPRPEQVEMLHRMAPIAASALENARLHAELRRLSLTDPLVHLPNRRQLDFVLEREFSAAQRGRSLCFALFDLDYFKEYNDTYGHGAGDLALIRFAEVLRQETRAMSLAARYGGEEFAAVLSQSDVSGALLYAERVRNRLAEVFGDRLTVSAGIAAYSPEKRTPGDLIAAADRALYRAKQQGRNRVMVEE